MKPVMWLGGIVALRFLGLFIVMPLLSVYALGLEGGSAFLAGIAVGGYALSQMLFQYPFGRLSDRFGRKPVILFGLLLFIIGSVACAVSEDIYTLLIGRLLQGAGAISATITALVSDIVGEEKRAKAMATIGMFIGMSFAVSMIAGPLIGGYLGVHTLFWLTAVFAVSAIAILYLKVPTPPVLVHAMPSDGVFRSILKDGNLMRLNLTMLLHSSMMTIGFLSIPIVLVHTFGWERTDLWEIYLPAIIAGMGAMGLGAVQGEKRGRVKEVFLLSILLFGAAFVVMGLSDGIQGYLAGVILFFLGVMMLEPLLQSTVTKFAKASQRGAALGVFNTVQFVGVFAGGALGGYVLGSAGKGELGLILGGISLIWFLWTLTMARPVPAAFVTFLRDRIDLSQIESLAQKPEILDIYEEQSRGHITIKYDKRSIDRETLSKWIGEKGHV